MTRELWNTLKKLKDSIKILTDTKDNSISTNVRLNREKIRYNILKEQTLV